MKVLLDTCVWGGQRAELTDAGHDVVWVGDWNKDPGDAEVLAQARREERVLVTLDKDFGELVAVHHAPHSGIVRLVNLGARAQCRVLLRVLADYGVELWPGAILTVEPGRVRVRPFEPPQK